MGMIRGYDSRTLIKCFPAYFMYGYLLTLNPKMIHMLLIIPDMERFGAGCCRCACCCQSGVCALERACWCPLSATARCWCRVLLAVRVACTVWSGDAGGAQGAAAGSA